MILNNRISNNNVNRNKKKMEEYIEKQSVFDDLTDSQQSSFMDYKGVYSA